MKSYKEYLSECKRWHNRIESAEPKQRRKIIQWFQSFKLKYFKSGHQTQFLKDWMAKN